jgi:hypothetical protein
VKRPKPAAEFLNKLGYIHEQEVAGKGRSVRSLRRMAARGDGPPRQKFNNQWYYNVDAFRAWLASKAEQKALPRLRRRRRS